MSNSSRLLKLSHLVLNLKPLIIVCFFSIRGTGAEIIRPYEGYSVHRFQVSTLFLIKKMLFYSTIMLFETKEVKNREKEETIDELWLSR